MTTAQELVQEIAGESPNEPDDWDNVCKFCRTRFGENDYNKWLENEAWLNALPNERVFKDHWSARRVKWEHHDSDCLWVRANKIIRG